MRPTPVHYVLARAFGLTFICSGVISSTIVSWSLCHTYRSLGVPFKFDFGTLEFAIATLVAFPLGSICGGMLIWPFVFFIAHLLCGAPFQTCDWVYILKGPHRNKLVRVYDVWDERNQVRVELGVEARQATKDVFSYNEVFRESRKKNRRGGRRFPLNGQRGWRAGGIHLGVTSMSGSNSLLSKTNMKESKSQLLGLCHIYLRNGVFIVPTVKKEKYGRFFDAEPVATAESSIHQEVLRVIKAAISTVNPEADTFPTTSDRLIVLKYANLDSWAEFEESAICWLVAIMENDLRLIPQRKLPLAGWEADEKGIRAFSGGNAIEELVNTIADQVQRVSRDLNLLRDRES